MKYAAGHADAVDGEQAGFSCLFSFSVDPKEKRHGGKTRRGTGCGVEYAEESGEQKTRKKDSDNIDQKCRMRIHPVQGKDNYKIGKAELYAGKTRLERNQRLQEGKSKCQRCQHAKRCQLLRRAPLLAVAGHRLLRNRIFLKGEFHIDSLLSIGRISQFFIPA